MPQTCTHCNLLNAHWHSVALCAMWHYVAVCGTCGTGTMWHYVPWHVSCSSAVHLAPLWSCVHIAWLATAQPQKSDQHARTLHPHAFDFKPARRSLMLALTVHKHARSCCHVSKREDGANTGHTISIARHVRHYVISSANAAPGACNTRASTACPADSRLHTCAKTCAGLRHGRSGHEKPHDS
jgi:hypothetical protein